MPEYQPTLLDMQWAKSMLKYIKDGGTLGFPATALIYRVDHQNKRLVLTNPEMLAENFHSYSVQMRTIETFKAIGYEVIEPAAAA
jgi:hypothetical protein